MKKVEPASTASATPGFPRGCRIRIVSTALAALLAAGCESDKATKPEPIVVPPASLLSVGIPQEDSLAGTAVAYYAAQVTPGARYVACITALSDSVEFSCFDGDSTFTQGLILQGPNSSSPQACSFAALGDRAFVRVRSFKQLPATVAYTMLIMGAPSTADLTTEIQKVVPRGVPTYGHLPTRGSSSYVAKGLTDGQEALISMIAATGDADLCPSLMYDYQGSVQECRGTAVGDSLPFGITCGPLNRDGAAYILLVK